MRAGGDVLPKHAVILTCIIGVTAGTVANVVHAARNTNGVYTRPSAVIAWQVLLVILVAGLVLAVALRGRGLSLLLLAALPLAVLAGLEVIDLPLRQVAYTIVYGDDDGPGPPDRSGPIRVAALGDSYSSGEGARQSGGTYLEGTDDLAGGNGCRRASTAFGPRIADSYDEPDLLFVACSGATVDDVLEGGQHEAQPRQIDSLRDFAAVDPVDFVVLSIGGNDVGQAVLGDGKGFGAILEACVLPNRCQPRFRDSIPAALPVVERRITRTVDALQEVVGSDKPIYLFGYPQIFPGRSDPTCNALLTFNGGEREFIRSQWTTLNETVRSAAVDAGATYVDVENAFNDHLICSGRPYAHGVILKTSGLVDDQIGNEIQAEPDTFHPTPSGHRCLARVFSDQVPEPLSPPTRGAPAVGSGLAC